MNKRNGSIFSTIALLAFVAAGGATLMSGCKPGISEDFQKMWPIWKQKDLEINKGSGNGVQYKHELKLKPQYYSGKMPLVFTSVQPLSGMAMGMGGGTGIVYAHEFDDFSNYFVYDGILLKGIVTVDKSKTMVAEARFEWQTDSKSGFYRPRMEEFHYSGGKLVFHCKSGVDYDTGTKIAESEQSGSKRREYFFLLPFGINAN